jgi:tRNA threonylcarbamoyladenosine biosynthesis protein TsaB
MYLLALETSTEYCSCALSVAGEVRELCVQAGHTHSERLLPMVAELMAEAGIGYGQLDVIAFGAGPGSFTGLRIACGAMQGLAFAHDLPVVPVSTLEALAADSDADRVLTCLDARMGELYLAAYERAGAGWREVFAPALLRTDNLPQLEGQWTGIGSGLAAHGTVLHARYALSSTQPEHFPRARAIAALALVKAARGETVAAEAAAPFYLRDKVALDKTEQAALRAANQAGVAA